MSISYVSISYLNVSHFCLLEGRWRRSPHRSLKLSVFYKILAVRREDIDQNARLETDAAVLDTVRLEKRVALSDFMLLPVDREEETAALYISDLCVRVMVELSDCSRIKRVLDDHHVVRVGEDSLCDAFSAAFRRDVLIIYPSVVFYGDFSFL